MTAVLCFLRHVNVPVRIDVASVIEQGAVSIVGYAAIQQLSSKPYHLLPSSFVLRFVTASITPPAELALVAALSALLYNFANCAGEAFALHAIKNHVSYCKDSSSIFAARFMIQIQRQAIGVAWQFRGSSRGNSQKKHQQECEYPFHVFNIALIQIMSSLF